MPKPLITIFFLALASLAGLAGVVFFSSPYLSNTNQVVDKSQVAVFLGFLFTTVLFGLTTLNFVLSQILFGRFTSPRQQIRTYLKRYAILGLGLVGLALMQLTHTLNWITAGLLLLTALSLLYTLQG